MRIDTSKKFEASSGSLGIAKERQIKMRIGRNDILIGIRFLRKNMKINPEVFPPGYLMNELSD